MRDGEVIQYVHMVNALIYASVECTPQERLKKAACWYLMFAKRELSLATPHWLNLRFNGNTGSCFVLSVADNTDSIMDNAKRTAEISRSGGGVGVYWGYVRAQGDSIQGEDGRSGGALPMMKIFNETIIAFNQLGKRKGAITSALPVWHADIVSFLDSVSEVGDLRKKLFDTQIQVVFEDLFMRMVDDSPNSIWYTFSPHEVEEVLGYNLNDYSGVEFDDLYLKAVEAYKRGHLKVVREIVVKFIH